MGRKKKDEDEVIDTQEGEPEIEVIEEDDVPPQQEEQAEADSEGEAEESSEEEYENHEPDESEEEAEERRQRNAERRQSRREQRLARIKADKARIQAQERQINELTERLLKVENSQQGVAMSRMDAGIEHQETLIQKIKQAIATTEDRIEHSDLIDRLADEKLKLRDLKAQKDMVLKQAKERPRSNVSTERQIEQDRLTKAWMRRNPWYDASGKGLDSKITLAIDNEMVEEGIWDASTPEYFKELDRRLRKQIPHRYNHDDDDGYTPRRKSMPPNTSSRGERVSSQGVGKNQFILSKERKNAMIEAGIWDDEKARMKQIRAYQAFDREEAKNNR